MTLAPPPTAHTQEGDAEAALRSDPNSVLSLLDNDVNTEKAEEAGLASSSPIAAPAMSAADRNFTNQFFFRPVYHQFW